MRRTMETPSGYDPDPVKSKVWEDGPARPDRGRKEFGGAAAPGRWKLETVFEEAGRRRCCARRCCRRCSPPSSWRPSATSPLRRGCCLASPRAKPSPPSPSPASPRTWDQEDASDSAAATADGRWLEPAGHGGLWRHRRSERRRPCWSWPAPPTAWPRSRSTPRRPASRSAPCPRSTTPCAWPTSPSPRPRPRRLDATGPVWDAAQSAMDLAPLIALAGEQAGGAQRCLAFTVDYAKSRIQFGRAIGSFQAVKHMAADLLLESESAISAARNAAARLAEGAEDAPAAISLAAFATAPERLRPDPPRHQRADARRHRLHLGAPGPPLPAPRPRRRPAVPGPAPTTANATSPSSEPDPWTTPSPSRLEVSDDALSAPRPRPCCRAGGTRQIPRRGRHRLRRRRRQSSRLAGQDGRGPLGRAALVAGMVRPRPERPASAASSSASSRAGAPGAGQDRTQPLGQHPAGLRDRGPESRSSSLPLLRGGVSAMCLLYSEPGRFGPGRHPHPRRPRR